MFLRVITYRLPSDRHHKLRVAAAERGLSMNAYLDSLVTNALSQQPPPASPAATDSPIAASQPEHQVGHE